MRILRAANTPFFLLHLLGEQIRAEMAAGHEVFAASGSGDGAAELTELLGGRFLDIPTPREISPLADLRALFRFYTQMRRLKPDIVHSTTPKSGLLCALAAFAAGVPIRIHTFTGQPWVEMTGLSRWITRTCDRIIVWLNTAVYCDSPSQKHFLESEGIAPTGSVGVMGDGSLSGVNIDHFSPPSREDVLAMRAELGLPADAQIIVFLGRVTTDKGVVELLDAFAEVSASIAQAHLILVGPLDERARFTPAQTERLRTTPRLHLAGYSPHPRKYLGAADLLALPSYREGFGTVVIEAAAMGLPTVGTRINGLTDAIEDGETGILVPPRDAVALASALRRLLSDETLRAKMGLAARERANRLFSSKRICKLILAEYTRLAAKLA